MHGSLFEHSEELTKQHILDIAEEKLGLDEKSFERELMNPKILSMVQKDFLEGQRAGVKSVPTIFVNGKKLKKRTLGIFKALIDSQLKIFKK